MPDPSENISQRTGPRSRKHTRRIVGWGLAIVGVWWLGTRGFPARWAVQSIIAGRTGLDLRAQSIAINFDGSIDLYDARVVAPDVQGPAGNVAEFARLHADLDWSQTFSSGPRISLISADGLVSRLSQSIDDSTLNSSSLSIKAQSGGRSTLPSILINSGRLEIGEHRGDQYTPLKVIPVRGSFQPSGTPDHFSISFEEVVPQTAPQAATGEQTSAAGTPGIVRVRGTLAPDGLDMELTGLTLDRWQPTSAPSPLRSFIRGLRVEGRVSRAILRYSRDEKISAKDALSAALYLDDVGISLPVEPPPPDASDEPDEIAARLPPTGPLRMTGVSGEIRYESGGFKADLKGLLEEFPYSVTLDYKGVSQNAPFNCTLVSNGFVLGKHPQLFRFAKPIVAARLNLFSEPTGIVDAEVTISRGPPMNGVAAEVAVGGVMRFHDTRAAFKRFPYEFRDMRGVVRFTDNEVLLENVTGTAPSGATVHATGRIAPLTADAGVDLDIVAHGIPIDDTLIAAMGPVRRRVIDRLVDRSKYEELVRLGLINAPGRPKFELGGKGNVDIKILRKPGPERIWNETIAVTLPNVGILPQAFGVPAVAKGVLVVVQDDAMSVRGGVVEIPSGGTANVIADANFGSWSDPDAKFEPDIHVNAKDVVVDPLLIHALPGPRADGTDELRRALNDLHLTGTLDVNAHLAAPGKVFFPDGKAPEPASWLTPDDTAFAVGITLKSAQSAPDHSAATLKEITGEIRAADGRVDIHLLADLETPTDANAGAVLATGHIDLRRAAPTAPTTTEGDISISATSLNPGAKVEDIVTVIAPKAGAELRQLRSEYQPAGRADVLTAIKGSFDGALDVTVDLKGADGLQFNTPPWLAGDLPKEKLPRVTVGPMRGVARSITSTGRPSAFEFKDFEAMLRCDDVPSGELRLSGDDLGLAVRWIEAPFQSPLVRALASGRLGSAVETAIRERNPARYIRA